MRLCWWNLAAALVIVFTWHAVRLVTETAAPTVKVRWKEAVSDSERQQLEDAFQLLNPGPIAARSYNYDLIDSRVPVIKALVAHPAVETTADLDRERFTVSTSTERGDTRRWLWHRWGRYDTGRIVAAILHLWLAASLALAGMIRYGTPPRKVRAAGTPP